MSYRKKGWAYSPETISAAIRHALDTSLCAAAEATGISTHCIRRHLILAGHRPAKQGRRARAVSHDHRSRLGALLAPRETVAG